MKKNMHLVIIVVLIMSVLVSGCQPLNKNPKEADEIGPSELKNIRSGNDGMSMDFVKNIPPEQIYDEEELTVMLNVKNKGAENIDEAWFYIGGFDPSIIPFDTTGIPLEDISLEGYLPGKDELKGEEGETVLIFTTQLNELPHGTDIYEPSLVVTSCYDYKTIASPVVCIDPNPFGVYTSSKSCQPKTVSVSGGQGGPIAVTKVEQVPSRGKVQFKIYIENKGKGKAVSDEKFDTCNLIEPTDYKHINLLDGYSIEASGLNLIKCQPDPENLRLIDDKGVIICSFDVDQSIPAYTTPLNVVLEYNYMESAGPKKIKILNI